MKEKCFVIVGQQPWDTEIGSNCKNIALEISKKHPVLYVNSPLDRITLWRNKTDAKVKKRLAVIKGKANGLEKIQRNLWTLYPDRLVESINWIRTHGVFTLFNMRNNRLFADSIRSAIRILGFDNVILFNDNEIFKAFYLRELLNPRVAIYYSRDYMLGVSYWKRHGMLLEPRLIEKSDLCFSNSTYLRNYCAQYNPESFYVGQGCDIAVETSPDCREMVREASRITAPIIGYVGSLDSNRLSIEIIEHIALNFPDHAVVLVGPEDETFRSCRLHQYNNVCFLGKRPVEDLPAYIQSFDVCINPQLVNEITIGNYPRKIDEYLVFGKPVVATATETMEIFKDVVYLASTKEDYIHCLKRALGEDSDTAISARKALVASHTWENSVNEMYQHIDEFANGRA
ncbi:glycosyltransferase [Parapedobacter sp. DT-150]|uniref:glycosyltransferase n=1 Tax=Parapedobacter sp. DT-150 TaxID=3396162 RepID=UPI003F1A8D2E